jgi:hypothetical protein
MVTYINFYGDTKDPHTLTKYVLDNLVIRDNAYQNTLFGFKKPLAFAK